MVQCQKHFPHKFACRRRRGTARVEHRCELVDIGSHYICAGCRQNGVQQIDKRDAAGLRRPGSAERGGVEAVEIDRHIDGCPLPRQPVCHAGQAVKAERVQIRMRAGERKFRLLSASDAELMYPAVPQQLVAAPHHTGVAQLRAEVVVAQVGVRVKMKDVQVGVHLGQRAHRAERRQKTRYAIADPICTQLSTKVTDV